ncbi:hypothetical protein TKK_0004698 [Trichogramma kaykai]
MRLREKIIHLLAIGVLGSELKGRIEKEGIKEGEIKAFNAFLGFVVSNIRNRKSDLKKSLWSEIDLNWPYYMEKEKLLVKKNKELVTDPPSPKDRSANSSSENGKITNLMQASSSAEKSAPQKREASTNLNSDPIKKPSYVRNQISMEQINDLLSDAISRDDFNIDRSKCLIDFSINCGYEYETGKHETAALHLLANIKPNNWVTLVKDLFKIYTNFDKEKLKVLNLLRSGERVANIVKRFNVNESTIRAVR